MGMKKAPSLIFIHEDNFLEESYDDNLKSHILEVKHLIHQLMNNITKFEIDSSDKDKKTRLSFIVENARKIGLNVNEIAKIMFEINQSSQDEEIKVLMSLVQTCYLDISDRTDMFVSLEDEVMAQGKDFQMQLLKEFLNTAELIEIVLAALQANVVGKLTEQSQKAKQLLKTIQANGVEIVPYREQREISLRVHRFLDEVDKGVRNVGKITP